MLETEKAAVLEHIRAKAAHFPGNEYAQVVLAEAERQLGELAPGTARRQTGNCR